ncbi:MAG: LLM class flavin-dependent oxidoreductase [Chloroflexia bacterium]|nr:LLM class flavin-dependent oxidoreductase [Chloroflexia bacterium]
MDVGRACHPWVASWRGRIGLALQAVVRPGQTDPGGQLIHSGGLADRYGYDAFFLGDHPAWAPDVWLHLAVIARLTGRVRLGQMVAAVPYRPPLLTARLASDLDHLSGGRSILGLGIGWNAADYGLGANEFDRMGLAYPPTRERQAALEEAIAIVRGVWGSEPFNFAGASYRVHEANVPAPLQQPEPPLIIAGGGPRTLGQVARFADACNLGPGPAGGTDTAEAARQKLAHLRSACEAAGRPYDDVLRTHFTHWLILAPTEGAVQAKVRRYFPDGLDAFWGAYLVAGTPAAVARHYQAYADAGVSYFVLQTLDPYDEETIALAATDLVQRIEPGSG